MKKNIPTQTTFLKSNRKNKIKLAFEELKQQMDILSNSSQKTIIGGADMMEFYKRMGFAFQQDSNGSFFVTSPVWQAYQSGGYGSDSGTYGSGYGSGYDSGYGSGGNSGNQYNYSGDYTTDVVRINGGVLIETHLGIQYYGDDGNIAFFMGVQLQTDGVGMGSGTPLQLNNGIIGISSDQANGSGGYNISLNDVSSVYGSFLQGIGGPGASLQTKQNLIKDLLSTALPGLSSTEINELYSLATKVFETAAAGGKSFDDSFFTGTNTPEVYEYGTSGFWQQYNQIFGNPPHSGPDGPGSGDPNSGWA